MWTSKFNFELDNINRGNCIISCEFKCLRQATQSSNGNTSHDCYFFVQQKHGIVHSSLLTLELLIHTAHFGNMKVIQICKA